MSGSFVIKEEEEWEIFGCAVLKLQ